ncbi:hypothetical protein BH09SUM1_BH09SUM1_15850 [soil metagenome]
MNAESSELPEDDLRPEYDFDTMPGVRQGRHFLRYWKNQQVRVLDNDLVTAFPDSQSINVALREYLRITKSG